MDESTEHARQIYAGRAIDPVEAASIHIALQELRDRPNSYLEVEIAEDDTAERIEGNCRAIAAELGMRLRFTVTATRHTLDALGRPAGEPSVLHVALDREP